MTMTRSPPRTRYAQASGAKIAYQVSGPGGLRRGTAADGDGRGG